MNYEETFKQWLNDNDFEEDWWYKEGYLVSKRRHELSGNIAWRDSEGNEFPALPNFLIFAIGYRQALIDHGIQPDDFGVFVNLSPSRKETEAEKKAREEEYRMSKEEAKKWQEDFIDHGMVHDMKDSKTYTAKEWERKKAGKIQKRVQQLRGQRVESDRLK